MLGQSNGRGQRRGLDAVAGARSLVDARCSLRSLGISGPFRRVVSSFRTAAPSHREPQSAGPRVAAGGPHHRHLLGPLHSETCGA